MDPAINQDRKYDGRVCSQAIPSRHPMAYLLCCPVAAPAQVAIILLETRLDRFISSDLVAPSLFVALSTSHVFCLHPQSNELLGSPHSRINSFFPPRLHFAFSSPRHQKPPFRQEPSRSRSSLSASAFTHHKTSFFWPSTEPKPLTASAFAIHT
jgi:hypothetical protein